VARFLVKQLYCYRLNTPEAVKALHKYREHRRSLGLNDLSSAIMATIRGFSGVYLILNTLDEYLLKVSEKEKLLNLICQIYLLNLENLHILCTSRKEVDIKKAFDPLFTTPSAGNINVNLSNYREKLDYNISIYINNTLALKTFYN
jgi:hypothetical protein